MCDCQFHHSGDDEDNGTLFLSIVCYLLRWGGGGGGGLFHSNTANPLSNLCNSYCKNASPLFLQKFELLLILVHILYKVSLLLV